jgi:plastocyanin
MTAVTPTFARPVLALATAVLTLLALGQGPSGADEQTGPDHVILVGAVAPDNPLKPYQFYDFYPRDLQVHQGDAVRWEFPAMHFDFAFHTVTFTPDPDELLPFRDDEVPGTIAFEEDAFLNTGCGRVGQPVCVLSDPAEHVNSGTPVLHADADGQIEPFDAVIDLPPGTYRYVCALHYPIMEGSIEVVADDAPLSNPSAEEVAARIAADTAAADELTVERSTPTFVEEGGARTWFANAGVRTDERGGAGLISFAPAVLEISAGDTVRWTDEDEAHSVTFPAWSGVPIADSFPIMFSFNCEPDEPNGGLPGVPMAGLLEVVGFEREGGPPPPGCPAGWSLEMTLNELAKPQPAPGDAVLTDASWHHSGFLGPEDQRGDWEFPSHFEATFPVPGEFTYRCYVHPEVMTGSVIVR